jgi:hypothetical protein
MITDCFNLGTKPDNLSEIVDNLRSKTSQWSQIILIRGLNMTICQKLSAILGLEDKNVPGLLQSVIITCHLSRNVRQSVVIAETMSPNYCNLSSLLVICPEMFDNLLSLQNMYLKNIAV